jgi:hypothetical protein
MRERPCPLINLSMQHRRTLEEAQGSLATAVHKVHSQCCSGSPIAAGLRQILQQSIQNKWL